MRKILYSTVLCSALFSQEILLDTVSVTATKIERETKNVPQSIALIDSKTINDKNIFNMYDAISSIPGVQVATNNGGYDARLIVRGAGLKANYGIREIMVLRDGVPMTDPDSFTRLDFIDVDDIDRVEISKGPGSIYNSNTTGGVIQILSKSVFDDQKNRIKFGFGEHGKRSANFRYGFNIDQTDYFAFSISRRDAENRWRKHNDFDTTQASLKYGHIFEDDAILESEISYTEANMDIPAAMNKEEFGNFKNGGKANGKSYTWQNSGRYSKVYFFNTRYEKDFENFKFKPRIYFTKWEHFHPVAGLINDSDKNYIYGTDLELNNSHTIFGKDGTLVFGLTAREDRTNDAKKYTYKDYESKRGWGGKTKLIKTLSNSTGDLANEEDSKSRLYGFYMQESIQATDSLLIDLGVRLERLNLSMDGTSYIKYNYRGGGYEKGSGEYDISEDYSLFSPKLGISYEINDNITLYGSIARGEQAPTTGEISSNRTVGLSSNLDTATSTNYELGLKARSESIFFDITGYYTKTEDEIVSQKIQDQSFFKNAGETTKKGLEASLVYKINKEFSVDGTYSYTDYKYDDYIDGSENYKNNYFKFIPRHSYTMGLGYENSFGFMARVEAQTWGSYYMDDANTEKYEGYEFVTNLMVGYKKSGHTVQLNVSNLFDKEYASSAEKSTYSYSYKAAEPRTAMLTYKYEF